MNRRIAAAMMAAIVALMGFISPAVAQTRPTGGGSNPYYAYWRILDKDSSIATKVEKGSKYRVQVYMTSNTSASFTWQVIGAQTNCANEILSDSPEISGEVWSQTITIANNAPDTCVVFPAETVIKDGQGNKTIISANGLIMPVTAPEPQLLVFGGVHTLTDNNTAPYGGLTQFAITLTASGRQVVFQKVTAHLSCVDGYAHDYVFTGPDGPKNTTFFFVDVQMPAAQPGQSAEDCYWTGSITTDQGSGNLLETSFRLIHQVSLPLVVKP